MDVDAVITEEQEELEELVAGRRRGGERLTAVGRHAVERHAMARTAEWLHRDRWTLTDTSKNRPYGFLATRGDQRRFVGVKGTTGDGTTVPVTAGELDHARAYPREALLVVVSDIELAIDASGDPAADGGILRYVLPWSPTHDDLRTVAFMHSPTAFQEPALPEARLRADAWEDFVAAVAQHRRHKVENGDTAWATVCEALRREGWELAPYQPGGASGAVLRRAINDAFARGLVPDDDSLVKRRRR